MFKSTMSKLFTGIGVFFVGVVLLYSMAGVNDAGYRTVIQYLNGNINVRFKPGVYLSWFGKTDVYKDVITFDYECRTTKNIVNDADGDGTFTVKVVPIQDAECVKDGTLSQTGVGVRYQAGGEGTTYGNVRFQMPMDEPHMIVLHKQTRSNDAIGSKVLRPAVKDAHQSTAGLMTSEEAYAEKRSIYASWVRMQLDSGKFVTRLEEKTLTNNEGKSVTKNVPVPVYDESGNFKHEINTLDQYGITVVQSPLTDWDFEPKTLQQIATKREATMAIITAKANAERAKQDKITSEEQGKANVMKAKYIKEVTKEEAIVLAKQEAEVAVIKAMQLVDVAEQVQKEQEQLKLAAYEEKKKLIAKGQGEAERKRLVMEADGALALKGQLWKEVNFRYADNMGKQKWVSEVSMGGTGGGSAGNGSNAAALIDMFMVKTAKDLSLDMQMKGKAK